MRAIALPLLFCLCVVTGADESRPAPPARAEIPDRANQHGESHSALPGVGRRMEASQSGGLRAAVLQAESSSGRFQVVVESPSEAADSSGRCRGVLIDRGPQGADDRVVWSGPLINRDPPRRAYLDDSGEFVLTLGEHGRRDAATALVIYGPNGRRLARFHLREILSRDELDAVEAARPDDAPPAADVERTKSAAGGADPRGARDTVARHWTSYAAGSFRSDPPRFVLDFTWGSRVVVDLGRMNLTRAGPDSAAPELEDAPADSEPPPLWVHRSADPPLKHSLDAHVRRSALESLRVALKQREAQFQGRVSEMVSMLRSIEGIDPARLPLSDEMWSLIDRDPALVSLRHEIETLQVELVKLRARGLDENSEEIGQVRQRQSALQHTWEEHRNQIRLGVRERQLAALERELAASKSELNRTQAQLTQLELALRKLDRATVPIGVLHLPLAIVGHLVHDELIELDADDFDLDE